MFGYVTPWREGLTAEQFSRYRGCYCGLCRCLKDRFGALSRLILSYDMTFLILLLQALEELPERSGADPCPPHPLEKRGWWQCEVTDYAADLSVALAYFKLLDDWKDEGSSIKKQAAERLRPAYLLVRERLPRQCGEIEAELQTLSRLEEEQCAVPDQAAAAFGRLMAALFVRREDPWTPDLRALGFSLGELVYCMDAGLDQKKDARHGSYNPFLLLWGEQRPLSALEPALLMLAGACAGYFERLPLVQDYDLLKNILYSGVWLRYRQARTKEESHAPDEAQKEGQR